MSEKTAVKKYGIREQQRLNKQLFYAVESNDLPAVKKAVENGADINARDKCKYTPLYNAIFADIAITEYLLENGANPNLKNIDGRTVLYWVADFKNFNDKAELYLKYNAEINIKDFYGYNPFVYSELQNNSDLANIFVLHGYVPDNEDIQKIKNNRLFNAVIRNDLIAVKTAIKDGAEVNSKNISGETLLYQSIDSYIDITIPEHLLKNGASPNIPNNFGKVPLHRAAEEGNINKIGLLLCNGADMYISQKEKTSISPFVCAYNKKHYDAAEFFVLRGYLPSDEDFKRIKDITERVSVKKRFMDLAAAVREHNAKLREESEAIEFTYADEVIEM